MATARSVLVAVLLSLALPAVLSQKPAAAPAPSPASTAPNVTAVLDKAGQYTKFMRLMKSTQQDTQLNSQLNGSDTGFTVFAPTDNAFDSLKAGTLNSLSQQEQVSLVQAHIVPAFFSMESFETASNPVRTQASGADGPYTVNVTATSNGQVNVSTGLVSTMVGTALRKEKPLAVYSVDKVLLPYDLFGPKPPASAPPAPGKKAPAKGGAKAPAGEEDSAPASKASGGVVGFAWSFLAAVAAACLL
ncbi:fasciclin-like arabinogalactan protein 11 [Brachypodium distachyon]|uniref:FAS1 domain-containing protein n=1 Tax=Brachypodium distachyon TaxID=15368 RepID=I1HGF0_BRADI|nr:fasciclin-like arabinogalactan protein 11 [Brachypodium distachyon]KQK04883.1 hypothetical protein BRADI_2g16570v3 [Brachypodium distachyon]|eukprot:XP_003567900.1 fasciclin-like arabinogalactan protein 11 [Brachypodium distachyon]